MKTYFTPEQIHAVSRSTTKCFYCGQPTLVSFDSLLHPQLYPHPMCDECFYRRMYFYHRMQFLQMYDLTEN